MVSHHHSRWAWGTSAQHLSSSGSWPRCLFLLHNSRARSATQVNYLPPPLAEDYEPYPSTGGETQSTWFWTPDPLHFDAFWGGSCNGRLPDFRSTPASEEGRALQAQTNRQAAAQGTTRDKDWKLPRNLLKTERVTKLYHWHTIECLVTLMADAKFKFIPPMSKSLSLV